MLQHELQALKIKLHFPPSGLDAIRALGLRQTTPETLRLVQHHQDSHYGQGVLLRGMSGEVLDGAAFAALHQSFGAWIACDSILTAARVQRALGAAEPLSRDSIRVVEGGAA